MAIEAGVGLSQNLSNSRAAGVEAARGALSKIKHTPEIAVVFGCVRYNQHELLQGVREVLPNTPVLGGSTSGEVTTYATIFDAVVVLVISSDQISFSTGLATHISKDCMRAGRILAEEVEEESIQKPRIFLMFPDGITGDGEGLVRGAQEVLGDMFPIVGGSLGDEYKFERTYQYYNDEVYSDAVVGFSIAGECTFGIGLRHGWMPVGLPMRVTESEGAYLKRVDDKPALTIYQEYFGKTKEELTREPLARITYTYPLGIHLKEEDEYLIRDPISANQDGAIKMSAHIPEGSEIRLMIGDADDAIKAAQEAARTAVTQLRGRVPKIAFIFTSLARNKLFGVYAKQESQAVQDIIGHIPLIGFYTYGEQGPIGGGRQARSHFHNETIAILLIAE